MAVNNTISSISWLVVEPEQKKFRSCITYRYVLQRAKKPSHATVPFRILPNWLIDIIVRGMIFIDKSLDQIFPDRLIDDFKVDDLYLPKALQCLMMKDLFCNGLLDNIIRWMNIVSWEMTCELHSLKKVVAKHYLKVENHLWIDNRFQII